MPIDGGGLAPAVIGGVVMVSLGLAPYFLRKKEATPESLTTRVDATTARVDSLAQRVDGLSSRVSTLESKR